MARDRSFPLLLVCFLLSGLAGLIYETVWTEQFALVFGTSELAVATVLGAYMGGLAAGAAIARRFLSRLRRPVRVYALLELGIALSALAVPAALALAGRLQLHILGGDQVPPEAASLGSALFYVAAAFAILLLPTALMGATLPLLARHAVRCDLDVGPRVGWLYTANTAGAAAGTLIAAFVLLPRLGLRETVLVAVAVNILVFVLATLLARSSPAGDPVAGDPATGTANDVGTSADASTARSRRWILPLILASGFVSFSWEVLWTRLLSHLLGGTLYAFGAMLATFLAGIGLGAAVASRLSANPAHARRAFAVAQIGIALMSLGAFSAVDHLPQLVAGLAEGGSSLFRAASLAALTLFPGAVFMGATFPFAVRILAGGVADAAPASARVYAFNTVGAIGGALTTGFVLLPGLGIAGTATLAVGLSLGLAVVAALFSGRRGWYLAAVAATALVSVLWWPPTTPWRVLRTAPLSGQQAEGELAYFGVGRSATVLLIDDGGRWRLSTNGLPEAAIQPPGSRVGRFTASRWMSLLPLVSRPQASSLLVVGLGAGLTIEDVPAAVREIHVVELEPEVVLANRAMAAERQRDPLADPRLSIHINDARSALALSARSFDAIVSQPSHPWTSGSSHLFTREFFSLVRQRLGPKGVFVQWIGVRYVDADLLRTLVATLADVFVHVEVYQPFPGSSLLFLCGMEPLSDPEVGASGFESSRDEWRRMGIFSHDDILIERLLTSEGSKLFGAGAVLNTDFRNLLKIRSPKILAAPIGARGVRGVMAELDSLNRLPDEADDLYIVRRLIARSFPQRARRVGEQLSDPARRRVAGALADLATGHANRGEKALWSMLDSGSRAGDEAFSALLLRRRRDLAVGNIPQPLALRLAEHPQAAAVVEGWRRMRGGDPAAIRGLEPRLAEIGPRHGLFDAATLLRVIWRQAHAEPELARQALALLEPWLAHGANAVGLLRRAELAVVAGERQLAVASLVEMIEQLASHPRRRALARRGMSVLDSFPAAWQDTRHERLRSRLSSIRAAG